MRRLLLQISAMLIFFNFQITFAQVHSISGQLVNGKGGSEKLDHVNIKFYLNNELLGSEYTDDQGCFYLNFETGVNVESAQISHYRLHQNYPNPFSRATTIFYELHQAGKVTLEIFNILGQRVRLLVREFQSPGRHIVTWDGRDEFGQICRHGTYFYRLRFEGHSEIRKMCLLNVPRGIQPIVGNPAQLAKSNTVSQLELRISDRDIRDTTMVFEFASLPAEVELNKIQVHVYPFAKTRPDTLPLMAGENISDTLNIYFEKPIEISSPHIDVDFQLTQDSLIAITYYHVYRSPVYLAINEVGDAKISYVPIYFRLSPRLGLAKAKFRRGYIGITYFDSVRVKNYAGEVILSLESDLPSGIEYQDFEIRGAPTMLFEAPIFFTLRDDRNVTVPDSAILIIREPYQIDFNGYTVDKLSEYPTNGTHPYKWVDTYTGVTEDLYYKGVRIAKANPDGSKSCYCCGLTFEVFFKAIQQLNSDLARDEDVNNMTANDMKYFISLWFVQSLWGDGPGIAMKHFGIGDVIADWDSVQAGDFVQLWRTTGSGHSVIFIKWMTNAVGEKTGIYYWSTQGSTNGIGFNTEYFSGKGGSVDPAHIYFSRIRSPENFTPFYRLTLPDYEKIINSDDPILPKYFMNNEKF